LEQPIANLFNKMGFEAYPAQRPKDSGAGCIASYKEPVVGGKAALKSMARVIRQ
jgi:hypothetical protein